mmetsp:Transcript_28854/g.65166  ORF Transcript_28854/g.65166 Transcript_28854/m.65166 type:complete len:266 (-) Transcript_28854:26-823(-)
MGEEAADNSATVPTSLVEAPAVCRQRPRVLCLHGSAGNGRIFRRQLEPLIQMAEAEVEFIFGDGCFETTEENAQLPLMRKVFPGEEYKEWCAGRRLDERGWRQYDGLDAALARVQELLLLHAPIDGLLGFSMGSNVASIVAAQASCGEGVSLRCVVHLCASLPGWTAQYPELFALPIPAPPAALICRADGDELKMAKGGADALAALYAAPRRTSHPEGHRPLPKDSGHCLRLCTEIRDFLLEHCGSEEPLAKVACEEVVGPERGA